MKAIDLGKTQITDDIRVSSAAIWYDQPWFGSYYQVETFIFSNDKDKQRQVMVIHGTTSGDKVPQWLIEKCAKVHNSMVKGLTKKHILNK